MSWTQTKGFNQSIATKIKNLCLGNVQSGFGIPGKYYSAWEAWLHTQQHTDPIPTGVDVPVFFSYTATIDGINKNWGHIGVRLANGTFWSDGTIYPSIEAYQSNHSPRYVGWGESVNDVIVIKKGQEVITANDVAPVRIVMSEVEGWNGNDIHSGKNDAQIMGAWVGKTWPEFIYHGWTVQHTHRQNLIETIGKLQTQVNNFATADITDKAELKKAQAQATKLSADLAKAQEDLVKTQTENKKALDEANAKQTEDTVLLDQAGNWLTKLFNRIFKKG